MNLERAKELLNAIIEHELVGEKLSDTIQKLLNIGFTKEELITEFYFNESDVNDAAAELKSDEDEDD